MGRDLPLRRLRPRIRPSTGTAGPTSVPNLFVTDGSFMPTIGGVPNTLTIEANALRVGDRIVALAKARQLLRRG